MQILAVEYGPPQHLHRYMCEYINPAPGICFEVLRFMKRQMRIFSAEKMSIFARFLQQRQSAACVHCRSLRTRVQGLKLSVVSCTWFRTCFDSAIRPESFSICARSSRGPGRFGFNSTCFSYTQIQIYTRGMYFPGTMYTM